ncbi:hypothetical protein OH76DRAFT_112658 [Lentinus brumalis]|uniref:Secreted protein n=1 Tax=Lentinus brumalis TaxID=2498619 RepID=A0A371CQ13_9APHY|nr:hypothetical protein OH76DRAFT_112658 [Polyporus brumalis]
MMSLGLILRTTAVITTCLIQSSSWLAGADQWDMKTYKYLLGKLATKKADETDRRAWADLRVDLGTARCEHPVLRVSLGLRIPPCGSIEWKAKKTAARVVAPTRALLPRNISVAQHTAAAVNLYSHTVHDTICRV